MIPYFQFTVVHLGPLTLYVWGIFAALGLLAGGWVAARLAKERGLKKEVIWDLAAVAGIAGIVGGRLFHVFLYAPGQYAADPLSALALWDGGISIMGSMLGAVAAVLLFLRKKKLELLPYLDTLTFGFPLGYAVGRIGCFLIHDHPGTLTHFFLGVKYPDGVRHDLGLYELFNGIGLFLLFLFLKKRGAKPPTYLVAFLLWYGSVRFLLDFLRAADVRYFGLTPAQYVSALLSAGGVGWLAWRGSKKLV